MHVLQVSLIVNPPLYARLALLTATLAQARAVAAHVVREVIVLGER